MNFPLVKGGLRGVAFSFFHGHEDTGEDITEKPASVFANTSATLSTGSVKA